MSSDYVGIDYSLGRSNYDLDTGIHYGVISAALIVEAWYSDSEPYHPCSECEYAIDNESTDCLECELCELASWYIDSDGYLMETCLDSDVMVLKSPYYTYCQYCSPCIPGAGNLECYVEHGIRAYCLPSDWFENGIAPYRYWRVDNNKEVR